MISLSRTDWLGITLICVLSFLSSPLAASHPYHVSFAEVEWNPKTGNFEVGLCVWPADLEKAISKMENRSVDLDKEAELSAICKAYVVSRFRIVSDKGRGGELRWVGEQVDLKQAWLYFEITGDQNPGNWKIDNRVFFELNSDQLNQIQVKTGSSRTTFASTIETKCFPFETKLSE